MDEIKIACFICGAGAGSMCRAAGRVGADRFAPHAGRVIVASLVSAGMPEAIAVKAARS